jgi:hypothetical protein
MREIDPHSCIDFILKNAPAYAKAKGELAELEIWKSSCKAIEFAKSGATTVAAKEMDAYASKNYIDVGKAISVATENVELLKWQLEAAKLRHATWQTMEVSNRNIDKITR